MTYRFWSAYHRKQNSLALIYAYLNLNNFELALDLNMKITSYPICSQSTLSLFSKKIRKPEGFLMFSGGRGKVKIGKVWKIGNKSVKSNKLVKTSENLSVILILLKKLCSRTPVNKVNSDKYNHSEVFSWKMLGKSFEGLQGNTCNGLLFRVSYESTAKRMVQWRKKSIKLEFYIQIYNPFHVYLRKKRNFIYVLCIYSKTAKQ